MPRYGHAFAQRPHGSIVPRFVQQFGWLAFVQSALSRQIVWPVHVAAHAIAPPPDSQHGVPVQSSTPSHVAAMPAHVAPIGMHVGPLRKSAQHFCVLVHAVAPHATPVAGSAASMLLPPLPPLPLHRPSTHG